MLLVLKEIRATRGFQAEKAVTVYLEVLDHKDFRETPAETDSKVLPVPVVSLVTRVRWEGQVLKVRKAV